MPKDRLTARNGVNEPSTSDHVSAALNNKKKQLYKDIEDFKKQKEEEYQEYERQLRRRHLDEDTNGPLLQDGKIDTEDESRRKGIDQSSSNSARRVARESRTARESLSQAFGGFPGPPGIDNEHPRDKAFEDFFTPEYLGLINGDDLRSHRHLLAEANSGACVQLSSSDTSNPANPPIAPPPLSSSAPTHSPTKTHHRSDSSNSLLSVSSLRSSMKDPNTPKSPKRVLFSIEDGVVVSPSTSPTISRKSTAEQGGITGNENENENGIMDGMLELGKKAKKKKNRRKERGGEDGRGRQLTRNGLEVLGASEESRNTLIADGWTKSIPAPLRPSPSVNGATHLRSLNAVVDDFEKAETVDEDDVFAFDEDLEVGNAAKEEKSDSVPSKEFDDEEEIAKEPLTGSSPHAGSLPIEIRWPGRRDTGG